MLNDGENEHNLSGYLLPGRHQRLHSENGQGIVNRLHVNLRHRQLYIIENPKPHTRTLHLVFCSLKSQNHFLLPTQLQYSTCLQLQSLASSLHTMSAYAIIVSAMDPTEFATWELLES
jgi:hypothetical protein